MEDLTKLILALQGWAWIALGIFAFLKLLPALVRILESRGFTLKIAGQELTVQDTAEQFSKQIADLQNQVIELRKQSPSFGDAGVPAAAAIARGARILWVDDKPSNNAWAISQLQARGIEVVQAVSTSQAVAMLGARSDIRAIISDMGRQEADGFHTIAGLELLRALRDSGDDRPFIICTTGETAARRRQEVLAAGGDDAVSSQTYLVEWVVGRTRTPA